MKKEFVSLFISVLILTSNSSSQTLENIGISVSDGMRISRFILTDSTFVDSDSPPPVFSFYLNGSMVRSNSVKPLLEGSRFVQYYEESLKVTFRSYGGGNPGWRGELIFENIGFDTLTVENVLLFGERSDNVYITSNGPSALARAYLNIPDRLPVRVILPDNAWESGYSSMRISDNTSVATLSRRGESNGSINQRYKTIIPPRATVSFNLYGDTFTGEWQNGLKMVFRERYLYDLFEFDNSLFERDDLKWIRSSYLIVLQFAWDKDFFDRFTNKFNYGEVIREANNRFGHIDVYGVWPTWPRLGIDSRNQWDLYRDLPGGTEQLRNFARLSRQYGTRFFVAYNPWDQSTRQEDSFTALASMIKETEADGVVLDTRGSSSYELQSAADSVRNGVVMYSEGMAVVKDMPGIVSGRVHNAIFIAPELNLNKLIKPEFAIFRVLDVGEAPLHREIAVAFFNGYGSELNMFRPGRGFQLEKDLSFLSKTTKILRESSSAFLDQDWTPLIETNVDNVFVNNWKTDTKSLYTVLNLNPEGIDMPLIKVDKEQGFHYYSLWNNVELEPIRKDSSWLIPVTTDPYSSTLSGSRLEGSVDCIARFENHLSVELDGRSLRISTDLPGEIIIWKDEPSYTGTFKKFYLKGDTTIFRETLFDRFEGKSVVQLFNGGEIADARSVDFSGGLPWLVSELNKTPISDKIPKNMLVVPGETLNVDLSANDNFIPYPDSYSGKSIVIDSFLIDKYPVTNEDYYRFIMATDYYPADTLNYLRHWSSGIYRQGQDKYPVVYISLEDAKAFAKWAEKRLPTEMEWQLAAQGTDGRIWPWGDEFHGTKCNNAFERPTPVDAFSKGQSPYGVFDMVGNVWQLTNDVYDNGSHYFIIIRGGSHYKPTSSWWYVQGGPQPLNKTQMMPMVSQGFDRNSTVGFRCVKDIK
jgi:formylglycine-generating enzyme required for sulfatase activity